MATSTAVITVGPLPVEANGGSPFDDGKTYKGIKSMKIGHEDMVESIRIEYIDENGKFIWSPWHGPNNRTADEFVLDPDEFLISVSGTYTVESQNVVIWTLKIQSNKNAYGPYGSARAGALPFSTASTGGKIVGFFGRSGDAMYSIGTYLIPQDKISIGPFGGAGGLKFDYGTHPSIKELKIRYGEGFVSMQTLYVDAHDQEYWSDVHGRKVGGKVVDVKLDSDEYLISLSGYHTEGSNPVVQSLTFQSNKALYGPFGTAQGIPFSTSTTAGTGKIVGFHGTSAEYINSIAAYFEPLP